MARSRRNLPWLSLAVRVILSIGLIGAVMGLLKVARRKSRKLPSPAAVAYAPTQLSAKGTATLAQITDPNSPVGKPTRPVRPATRREAATT